MHPRSANNNDIKQRDMAAESNRVIKYKPISGRLHEHFGLFVTRTKHC